MRTVVGELPGRVGRRSGSPRPTPPSAGCPRSHPTPTESLLAYARRRTGVDAADRALHDAAEALATRPARRGQVRRRARALAAPRRCGPRGPVAAGGRPGGSRRRPGPPPRHPLRRPGRAGSPGRRAAQPVRRAAARRADQQPRRARAGADGRLRDRSRRTGAGRQPRPRVPRPRGHERSSSSTCLSSGSATTRQLLAYFAAAASSNGGRRARRSRSTPTRATDLAAQARQRADWAERGAPQRGPRAASRTSTSARSSGRGPTGRGRSRRGSGRAGRPARGGRPAAQGVGAALLHRGRGRRRPEWWRRWIAAEVERGGFRLGPVDLTVAPWRPDRYCPATTAAASPRCWGRCSAPCHWRPVGARSATRVRLGVIDQQRDAARDRRPGRRRAPT